GARLAAMAISPVGAAPRPAPEISAAVREASTRTGVDFAYLMAQAAQESGFKPDARAATGSAAGLYQFIDSTWLDLVRQHGAKHGLADLAAQIEPTSGGPKVRDAQARRDILGLRDDPRLSAAM